MSSPRKPKKDLKRPPLCRMSGEELRAWREKHGLTQQELAWLLGLTQKAISHWECGNRKIPPYMYFVLKTLEKKGYLE